MENRLKERLTGAAILVALVVLVVPELFRGGSGTGRSNAHRIPVASTDAAVEAPAAASPTAALPAAPVGSEAANAPISGTEHSFTFNLAAPPAPSGSSKAPGGPAAPSAAGASSASGSPSPAVSDASGTSGASVTLPPARMASSENAGGSASSEDAAVPAVAPVPAQAVSAAPSAPVHASPRRARALSTGWTVQLGVFADSTNARRLLRKARMHGFHAELGRVGARRLYRVAIPGLPDRAHAEQLRQRLRAQGFAAAVMR